MAISIDKARIEELAAKSNIDSKGSSRKSLNFSSLFQKNILNGI
jgi:hypothetical protein